MKRAAATGTNEATLVILAGGRSSRMGRPKAELPVEGQTLLEWMVRGLAPAFAETLVCGAIAPPGARSVADRHPMAGPLAGIESGLTAMRTTHAFVLACDIPGATPRLAALLLDRVLGHDAAVPLVGRWAQPVCAAYRKGVAPTISSYLDAGGRSLLGLIEQLKTAYVDEDALTSASIARQELADLDVPADYDAFIRWRGAPA